MISDFHTHDPAAREAIIAVDPGGFAPQPGLHYSVGIHPWHCAQATDTDWHLLRQAATHPQVVAIGETGLDALRGGPLEAQCRCFQAHLALAQQLDKPVVIHSVRTMQQVLSVVRRMGIGVPLAIHGMRGNERVARPLIEAGYYLSFGPRYNPATVLATPRHRLLIETDDSDTPLAAVAAALAATLGLTADQLMDLARSNAAAFVGCR